MEILQLPRLRNYWQTDHLYNLSAKKYKQGRYLIILQCWHFTPNPQDDERLPADRLYKIRPLVEFFNNKIFMIYSPGKNLTID